MCPHTYHITLEMNTFVLWEELNHSDVSYLYDVFFANNRYFTITYEDFAWYCYTHTNTSR